MNEIFAPNKPLAKPMQHILLELRDSSRAHIVLTVSDNATLRCEAIAELSERLSGKYALYEFDYNSTGKLSLPRFCRTLRNELPVCVFARGLEELKKRDEEKYETALDLLNAHREDIRETQTAVVLWLTSQTQAELLQHAPDFADWRTADVTFVLPEGWTLEETLLGRLSLTEAENLRRQARRLEEMLARPNLEPAIAGEFRQQLAYIHKQLGSTDKPERMAKPLRAVLTFLKEMGIKQVEQLPGIGPAISSLIATVEKLSDEEADQQLKQQVESLLAVGRQTQEDLKALGELSTFILHLNLQQSLLLTQLRDRLEAEGLPAEPEQLKEFAINTALLAYDINATLLAYRDRVAREYLYADYRGIEGITRAEHTVSFPLDDVYVMPRLQPERERTETREREEELMHALLDRSEDLSSGEQARLEEKYAVLTGERWRAGKKTEDEGLPVGETLQRARHVVIIGGPGVGKSTLIRYLARTCALGQEAMQEHLNWEEELTPIVISLAAFADARSKQPELSLRAFLDEQMTERGGDALNVAIAQEFTNGRAFVLLDGVDEVPDFPARSAVVQAVERFITDHENNRFLVTSRPYGYIRLKGELDHLQLPNFSSEQVEAFIRNWQRAFERWQHPDAPNFDRADAEAEAMLGEIRRNPKVEELATNPLMLVIIALIRHERTRLPEQRVQLYNRAMITLMDTWNYWRSQLAGVTASGEQLPINALIRVWAAVAEWTRREKPTGVVHRAELERKLVEILREKELDEYAPEATAESYLNAAADRAGLLEERGPDIFAFWHPTFEEFLAAVELATPASKVIDRLLLLREDPRWHEVILLVVGYIGIVQRDGETATEIVEAIADRDPSPIEPLLHPNLRLAADCIANDVGVKRSLAERILVRLAEIIQTQPYKPLTEAFVQTIRALPRLRPTPEAISALTPLVEHDDWKVRMEAARLFSNVTVDNAKVRALCEELLDDNNEYLDEGVLCHAALGLARSGDYRPEVWRALVRCQNSLFHIEDPVREFWVEASNEALDSLFSFLNVEENVELRIGMVRLLQEMERADEQIAETLFSWMTAADTRLRLESATLLYEMGYVNEQVVEILFSLLTVDDTKLRLGTAGLLQWMGYADERVAETLFSLLTVDDLRLRLEAAELLQEMGCMDEQVIDALVPCLIDGGFIVRDDASLMLQEMGKTDENVVATVASWLSANDPRLRLEAAELLQKMNLAEENVIETLFELLSANSLNKCHQADMMLKVIKRTSDNVVRGKRFWWTSHPLAPYYKAARLLVEMERVDERVIATLVSCLDSEDFDLCFGAACLLTEIGQTNEHVIAVLISWLDMRKLNLCFEELSMMVEIGHTNRRVIDVLVSWLNAEELSLRYRAAELLERVGRADERVISALVSCLDAEDNSLRYRAAELLERMGRADEHVVERFAKIVDSQPWAALAACAKVMKDEPLTPEDGEALAELVRVRPDDEETQRRARTWLFDWLRRGLEPGES